MAKRTVRTSEMLIGERGWYQGDYVELSAGGLTGGCPTDLYLSLANEAESSSYDDREIIVDTDDITA